MMVIVLVLQYVFVKHVSYYCTFYGEVYVISYIFPLKSARVRRY
jgi:hypothetical protein